MTVDGGSAVHILAPGRTELVDAVLASSPSSVSDALALAQDLAPLSAGRPTDSWEALATLGAMDVALVRAAEPHLDAAAILHEAALPQAVGAWGVFAAEGGEPLRAGERDGRWHLDGVKPWCSLADRLDFALITATVGMAGERRLFSVDLRQPGVTVLPRAWHATGLVEIPSGPVSFDDVAADPVGETGWYLSRPGFSWGGIGVAACWYGGAVGIARSLFTAAMGSTDPLLLMHLGAVDEQLQSARRALAEAKKAIDDGEATGPAGSLLAKRVRASVALACETTIARVGHALGPAPLALDAAHAKRVADLTLYIRQHHAERDDRSLGEALIRAGDTPW